MRKIRKCFLGSPGLYTMSFNNLLPIADNLLKLDNILDFNKSTGNLVLLNTVVTPQKFEHLGTKQSSLVKQYFLDKNFLDNGKIFQTLKKTGTAAILMLGDLLSDKLTNSLIGTDSEFGRTMGTLFSLGVSSAGNNMANNLVKGIGLTEGLSKNVGTSLAGTGAGIAANYIGKGINALGGDSRLSRALGQGVSTGLGTVGGAALSNLVKTGSWTTNLGKLNINPYALGMSIAGSALGAATGPSNEYAGKYGGITQGMDTAYDLISMGANAFGPVGSIVSGAMTLNKGLSNIFGSTDGMTAQDAILGSAFMPAPVKWLNMWGSSKTGTFNNLSWQNSERTNSFMGNAFGNLNDRFDKAREEAGKTYGTFSQGAKREAQENIDFANYAWNKILGMTDLNEWQNIRSLDMSSINNLRYAQLIQGGWNPIYIGKQGMKIFNNATNHNMGMRLLSAAALIDNKQMILSAQGGTAYVSTKQ